MNKFTKTHRTRAKGKIEGNCAHLVAINVKKQDVFLAAIDEKRWKMSAKIKERKHSPYRQAN